MKIKDCKMMLDSLRRTAIYVIREDNHEILYYNEYVKKFLPKVQEGKVCHNLWEDTCASCPLLHIEDKEEARSVGYNELLGQTVEITARRMVWADEIPAFILMFAPFEDIDNYTYSKVLWANLTKDSYNIIRADKEELMLMRGNMDSLSGWFEAVIDKGYIYEEDIERYRKFVQLERIKEELKNGAKMLNCTYRRRVGDIFRWHLFEIVPLTDYSSKSQKVLIYVKDVHDVLREGLEQEEVFRRNQEVITALGEENFVIYVINLHSGGVDTVRTSEGIREKLKRDYFIWEKLFREKGFGFIAPEDEKEFEEKFSIEALRKAWKDGEKKRTFTCRALLQGKWKYVAVTAYFSEGAKKEGRVILAFQDVDEQVRKEMERTRNDRQIVEIIKSMYNIMNTVDLETGSCERVYLRGERAEERLKDDYNRHIQKALDETVAEAYRAKFRDVFLLDNLRRKAKSVQDFKEEIFQYRMKGSPLQWVEEHVMYIRVGSKVTVSILGRDITAEKLLEERRNRELYEKELIINSLGSMFFAAYYIDLENDMIRSVEQEPDSGQPLLNKKRCFSQAIRIYASEHVCQEDREDYLDHMDTGHLLEALSREHPINAFEYRMVPDSDNRRAWIRASVVLADISDNGRPSKALYVAQDITESKIRDEREQQALREACDAANQASAAKSDFMSKMSHDIRTPMNGIIGMTTIAESHLDDRERVKDCLKKITVSSHHLLSLINEVLDMSRIESGKIKLAEDEINLPDLVGNLETMLRPSIQEKKHIFNVKITNMEHEDVIGDLVRLQQVFMNILGNSIKYTPPGGMIEMEIVEEASNTNGIGFYKFVFRDNGVGMSNEYLKKLFEPFSRAEDSRISKIEGTGLGMTIAKNIIQRMSGEISVESEIGKGTQFTIMISFRLLDPKTADTDPAAGRQKDAAGPGQIPEIAAIEGKRILLTEDNELNREIAEEIIRQMGILVESATDGAESVKRFEQSPKGYYDMILMDIQMPVMNGYEATTAIRRLPRADAAEIPIIAMTANAFAEDIKNSREAGMNEHLTKPLDVNQLAQCLVKWMSKPDDGRKQG